MADSPAVIALVLNDLFLSNFYPAGKNLREKEG
jgi:hypothetical protein